MDHLRNGDSQDKGGAVEFFIYVTRAYPELLKDVLPVDVQLELAVCLLDDWEVFDSMSE
jgi:hypothetical protein